MKKYLKISLCLLLSGLSTGCMKETFNTAYVSESEIGRSPEALAATARATIAWMTVFQPFSQATDQGFGYPAQMIIKDMMTADMPSIRTGYDRFNTPWGSLSSSLSSGNYIIAQWRWYYGMANLANITIRAIPDPENESEVVQQYYGQAAFHRALVFFDLCRMFEHHRSGVAAIDQVADENDLWGLTSLIIDEHTPDTELDNNPRVPFWHMYRFILTDLNVAEKYLAGFTRAAKNEPDLDVIYALKARFWLELATRFQKNASDLQLAVSHETDEELARYDPLNISSAADCYRLAAEYARKVIGNSAYRPLSEEEWFDVNNGFNNSEFSSWVYGAIMGGGSDAFNDEKCSFTGNMSLEYAYGNNGIETARKVFRMIGRELYDKIPESDWRKTTWLDPEDVGKGPGSKYRTSYTEEKFNEVEAYVGFKFRPRGGNSSPAAVASTGDIPIIRIEDLHFIEIEATAYLDGLQAGKTALENFMNTYRYTDGSYRCDAESVDELVDNHIILQKRIEFWGEGLTYYDLKRRELAVTRGYAGTNFLASHRYNSIPGYAPGWFTMHLPRSQEIDRNKDAVQNPIPDVATNYGLWVQ